MALGESPAEFAGGWGSGRMTGVRVLLAPDCFTGTLTALEAAEALAQGWRRARSDDELVLQPLSDGGPGFLDALPGVEVSALVEDPLARPTIARLRLDGTTGYVEAAQAAGLHLLEPEDRDPGVTTTYGVGQLVRAAVDGGATRVVVGVGGTATNDGGAGFLAALGLLTPELRDLAGGLALKRPADVATTALPELVLASDVDNPLLGPSGATRVFAPQKGASAEQVERLEQRMTAWADGLESHLGVTARDLPGAGAAGGLGFALLALGATRVPGLDVVADATGLAAQVAQADLVVTGEGRLDGQSVRGKVVGGVAGLALEHGVPCVAVAGEVLLGRREAGAAGLAETWALVDHAPTRALTEAAAVVSEVAEQVARSWAAAQ
jgi:glycerate kinase